VGEGCGGCKRPPNPLASVTLEHGPLTTLALSHPPTYAPVASPAPLCCPVYPSLSGISIKALWHGYVLPVDTPTQQALSSLFTLQASPPGLLWRATAAGYTPGPDPSLPHVPS
jgi:hypothetical protein